MNKNRKEIPLLPELAGEASPAAYRFKTGDSATANPGYAIFPIVKLIEKRVYLVGTGFFITTYGLFVTAKHVLFDAFDDDGNQKYGLCVVQFVPNNIYYFRPVLRCSAHPVADITVGVAAPMSHNVTKQPLTNPIVTLDFGEKATGTEIMTYAYPKHSNVIVLQHQEIRFNSNFYDGYIKEYLPNGRDKVIPGACYRTNMHIHGGASGGPVYSPNGHVFGVNSSGTDGTDISYISRVSDILPLRVDEVLVEGSPSPISLSISEFIRGKQIVVADSR